MKKITLSIISVLALTAGAITAGAQTADEIVQKHITAIGGADNWKKIKTMKMVGAVNAQGNEIPVTITKKDDKAMKVEFTVAGMTGYMILTDKAGWNYAPFGGQTKPEAMTEAQVKEQQDELDLQGEFIDYKAKGRKVVYLGKDDVEGTECFKLKLTYATGKEETVYIDASNYYHIRTVAKMKMDGKEMEQTSNFSNYQKLPEGIVFPMTIETGGGPVAIKTVEINKNIDDSIFVPKS